MQKEREENPRKNLSRSAEADPDRPSWVMTDAQGRTPAELRFELNQRYEAHQEAERQKSATERDEAADQEVEPDKPESDRGWRTIEEETGESKAWPNYRAAKRELGTNSETHIHHIVEQSQADKKYAGFDVSRINSTDNMTRIPVDVHNNITAHYNSKPPGFDVKVREWLGGKDWDFQFDYGTRVLNNEFRRKSDRDDD